jgi:hypothetical protein
VEHHAEVSAEVFPLLVDAGKEEAAGVLSTAEALAVIDQRGTVGAVRKIEKTA